MKKLILTLMLLALAAPALADNYNHVPPEKVKEWIESGTAVTIVDIQVADEFDAHHLPGSMATRAYPVKTDDERARLDPAVAQAKTNDTPVVIVCPRGAGGAERSYDYMKKQGIAEGRLLILEKGMAGWPYKAMVEKR